MHLRRIRMQGGGTGREEQVTHLAGSGPAQTPVGTFPAGSTPGCMSKQQPRAHMSSCLSPACCWAGRVPTPSAAQVAAPPYTMASVNHMQPNFRCRISLSVPDQCKNKRRSNLQTGGSSSSWGLFENPRAEETMCFVLPQGSAVGSRFGEAACSHSRKGA